MKQIKHQVWDVKGIQSLIKATTRLHQTVRETPSLAILQVQPHFLFFQKRKLREIIAVLGRMVDVQLILARLCWCVKGLPSIKYTGFSTGISFFL